MTNLTQTEQLYTENILNRINNLMVRQNIKQLDLSARTNIGQSTLSKILSGDMKLTLQHIIKISYALNVTPPDLLTIEKNIDYISPPFPFFVSENEGIINEKYVNEEILIRNTKHAAFRGYTNSTFYFYCYPTISTESGLLEGILTFSTAEKTKCCLATLILYTGKFDLNNQPIHKKYEGELIISISMSACYCILSNPDNAELITMNFNHMFINAEELICRVGTMISTSSGGNRLPVMQRVLISKYKLHISGENKRDLDFVKGQLKLNESTITIEEEKIKELREQHPHLNPYFEKCTKNLPLKEYYVIDEAKIRDLEVDDSSKPMAYAISLLRNASLAPKYNKISSKTDEYVFQYIGEHQQADLIS